MRYRPHFSNRNFYDFRLVFSSGAAVALLAATASCGDAAGGAANPTPQSKPVASCTSESMFSNEPSTQDEGLARALSEQVSAIPGVRSVVFSGETARVRVSPEFVEPEPGWATNLGIEIFRSCIPTALFIAAEQVIEDLGKDSSTTVGSVNYGLGSDNIDVSVAAAFDPAAVRAAILERYGRPIDKAFLTVHPIPVVNPANQP